MRHQLFPEKLGNPVKICIEIHEQYNGSRRKNQRGHSVMTATDLKAGQVFGHDQLSMVASLRGLSRRHKRAKITILSPPLFGVKRPAQSPAPFLQSCPFSTTRLSCGRNLLMCGRARPMRVDFLNVSVVQTETAADRLSWEMERFGRPLSLHPLERAQRRRTDLALRRFR